VSDFASLDLITYTPKTGAERQLTDLPSKFTIGDFHVSPDGTEIVFDRARDSSSIALLERKK
jgi:hypothetical protein